MVIYKMKDVNSRVIIEFDGLCYAAPRMLTVLISLFLFNLSGQDRNHGTVALYYHDRRASVTGWKIINQASQSRIRPWTLYHWCTTKDCDISCQGQLWLPTVMIASMLCRPVIHTGHIFLRHHWPEQGLLRAHWCSWAIWLWGRRDFGK